MLDLSQVKLVRSEWVGIEIPHTTQERRITALIASGYDDPSIEVGVAQPLARCLKTEDQDWLLYQTYLKSDWAAICKETQKYLGFTVVIQRPASYTPPKKADLIRFNNMRLEHGKGNIIEFVILSYLKAALRGKRKNDEDWVVKCFTAIHLLGFFVLRKAILYSETAIRTVLDRISSTINTTQAVANACKMIEDNPTLMKYAPLRLFEHQRQLFNHFKCGSNPRFIMYVAPTGTGKTLSPLGLISEYVVHLHVCGSACWPRVSPCRSGSIPRSCICVWLRIGR